MRIDVWLRVGWGAAMLTLLVVVFYVSPVLRGASNTSAQIAEAAELQACRSIRQAELSQVATDAQAATSRLEVASAELALLTSEALAALYVGDSDRMAALMAEAPNRGDAVTDAAIDAEAAEARARRESQEFQGWSELSASDPAAFLAECRESR